MRLHIPFAARLVLVAVCLPLVAGCAEVLTAPVTLVERAVEDRSSKDIVEDNKIVLAVNRVMADLGTIKASTEIYEQHLLITGIFDDRASYDKFRSGVNNVKGVKKLYWHAVYMSAAEQERRKAELVNWANVQIIATRVRAALVAAKDVSSSNFKTATDAFATVYVLGRAHSAAEMKRVLDTIRNTEGVRKVVNYGYVKPK